MNIFNHSSSKDGDFFYQAGTVTTRNAWFKPTIENVAEFLKDLKKVENYDKYKLFLVGAIANEGIGNTWDIDIIVNGRLDCLEIEKLFRSIYDLALNKHRLLVDVRWNDIEPQSTDQEKLIKTVRFGYYAKKIGEKKSEINLFNKNKRISEFLVESFYPFPNEKSKKRTTKFKMI